jgi:putative acetyltransferase
VVASLVADDNGIVVGHILFSRVFIHSDRARVPTVALAPMAVVPARQRSGVGTLLIRAGLDRCRTLGEQIVLVVGHPTYYPRFGFSHALTRALRSPYDGEAFMALELAPGALVNVSGEVRYPSPFAACQ